MKKKTIRTPEEKKNLIRRLNVAAGQVKGVANMVENDRTCDEILIQLAAISKSLKVVGKETLKIYLQTCVVDEIKKDNPEILKEVMDLFRRLE